MKNIFNKIKKHILVSTLIFVLVFVLLTVLLNFAFSVTFRKWVYILIAVISFIFLIMGIVQTIRNSKKTSTKIVIACFITFIATILLIYGPILFLLGTAILSNPEHVIEKDGKKYVAEVRAFLHVDVYYYDYINPFMRGNKEKIHEFYGDGGYDPFDGEHDQYKPLYYDYYDDEGKIINTNRNMDTYSNNDSDDAIVEENDILYRAEFGDTIIEVVNKGSWSGRNGIQIMKSTDDGENWEEQLDEVMDVHYDSKFFFANENLGFINDVGTPGTNGENSSFMRTTDGGKTFEEVEIKPFKDNDDKIYCDEAPYLEDGKLKVKVYTVDNSSMRYNYIFTSNNDGKTWEYIEN